MQTLNRTPQPAPKVGIVSLGCPKALVDSERILTRLRSEGYEISPSYDGADVVLVNTCGFLDSAKAESLDAIGEAMATRALLDMLRQSGARARRVRETHRLGGDGYPGPPLKRLAAVIVRAAPPRRRATWPAAGALR